MLHLLFRSRAAHRLRTAARALVMVLSIAPRLVHAQAVDAEAQREKQVTLDRQRGLMTTLGGWSLGSMVAGGAMIAGSDRTAVRWAGGQNLVWGAIDGAIALYALHEAHGLAGATKTADGWRQERAHTARIFWINVGLDVLYVAAGAALLAFGKDERATGSGHGVLAQGGFLLVFDTVGALVTGAP